MRYLAGISPVGLPNGFPERPAPIDLSFVRQDDESVAARRSAALEFEQLSGPAYDHSADDLACIQARRIACLADNADSRGDATVLARAILAADPLNYRVMIWVLARDLDVAVDASVAALEEKVRHEPANVEEIASLLAAYTRAGRFADGREVLKRTKEVFVRDSAQLLWDSCQSQLAGIESIIAQEPAGRLETRLDQVRSAAADGEWTARWQQYMLLAQLGRWEEIVPTVDELIASLQTPDAVRIASHALYNTRDFAACVAVLDRAPAMFSKGEVAPDLRRLRVLAQVAVGALPEAIKTAREVFGQSSTRDAFLELSHLYFQVGDFKNLAIFARGHYAISDLSGLDYLRLAFFLTTEDPALALVLWRAALAKGICTAPGFLDTRLRYAAWRSSYCWRASSGVRYASFSRRQHWL